MFSCFTEAELRQYLAGSLTGERQRGAAEHLRACRACTQLSQRIRDAAATEQTYSSALSGAPPRIEWSSGSDGVATRTMQPSDIPGPEMQAAMSASSSAPISLSIDEFLQTLSQSGLLPPQELVSVRAQPVAHSETGSTTADLIEWLIRQEKLTHYQAELLCRGRAGGLVLGNYIILDKLGQGGMGTVFKARHRRMNRIVALKVLPSSLSSIPEAIARFAREVEAVAKLQHQHIAAAYDADEAEGVHFLVMEHVDGPNLSAYVREKGPLPVAAAVRLVAQAAKGLAVAHVQGIVHRDIKPSNLMVNRQGQLKMLDLGLAQMRDSSSEVDLTTDVTQTGRTMGTVDYMAPEQARDAKTVDARADIYSLGCTLYFLLAGRTPAPPGSAAEKLLWHQTQEATPLIDVCDGCTARLEALVKRMMAKDPQARPASMVDVALELDSCLAELPAGTEDLSLDGIEIRPNDPSSTVHGSKAGRGTLMEGGDTLMSAARIAALSAAGPTQAQSRGRWIALAASAIGLAALSAVLFLPKFLRPSASESQLFVAATQTPAEVFVNGQYRGTVKGVDQPLELKLPPGTSDVEVHRDGFQTFTQRVQTVAGKPMSIVATLERVQILPNPGIAKTVVSPHAAYEKLLAWIWKQGGKVEVKTGDGMPLSPGALADLPPSPVEIVSIRLDGLGILDADLAQLKAAPRLVELSLSDTKITDDGLVHLRPLEDLTRLDLSQNNIQGRGLDNLGRMSRLAQLNLCRTAITDQAVARMRPLTKLRWLLVSDTALTDLGIEQLEQFKSLETVDLRNTGLSEALHDRLASGSSSLKEIEWDGADEQRALANRLLDKGATLTIAGHGPADPPIAGIRARNALPVGRISVKEVDLSTGAEFSDEDLKKFVSLVDIESLNLVTVNVTPAGIGHLQGLKSLKTLHLAARRLPPAVLEAFQRAMPQCQVVLKQPLDTEVARAAIGRQGRVTVVTPQGTEWADVATTDALPSDDYLVRAINLSGVQGIGDDALAHLNELTGLESLVLSGTDVTDAGVVHLAGCKALRSLTLSDTNITAAGIAALTRLPALRQLFLARTPLDRDGLKAITSLPGLTQLSLQGVRLADGDVALLKRLENLQSLDLSNTPLTDAAVEHLGRLAKVQSLNLQGTQLSDEAGEQLITALGPGRVIGDPPNRQRLAARWIVQKMGTVELTTGPLTNLRNLPPKGCEIVSIDLRSLGGLQPDDIVMHVSACTRLRKLNLSETAIGNDDLQMLAALPELTSLSLVKTSINDKGLKHLAGLTRLQSLDLTRTSVTGAGLAELSGLSELVQLQLSYAPVKADQLVHLAAFPGLRTLELSVASASTASIDNAALAHIAGLPALRVLELRSARITDAGLDELAKLKDLESLDLEGTPVTDAGIEKLGQLPRLRRVSLNRTSVTDGVTTTLAKIKTLRSIALKQTSVSASSLDTLQAALGPQCEIIRPTSRDPNRDANRGAGDFGTFGPATGLGSSERVSQP
jgi:serine/threonine protein kinase/Leucine-rich repeat (LRR) protein